MVAQLLLDLSQAEMFNAEKDFSYGTPMSSLDLEKIPLLDTVQLLEGTSSLFSLEQFSDSFYKSFISWVQEWTKPRNIITLVDPHSAPTHWFTAHLLHPFPDGQYWACVAWNRHSSKEVQYPKAVGRRLPFK